MRQLTVIGVLAMALAGCSTVGQGSTDTFVQKTLTENRTTLSVPRTQQASAEFPAAPVDAPKQ